MSNLRDIRVTWLADGEGYAASRVRHYGTLERLPSGEVVAVFDQAARCADEAVAVRWLMQLEAVARARGDLAAAIAALQALGGGEADDAIT